MKSLSTRKITQSAKDDGYTLLLRSATTDTEESKDKANGGTTQVTEGTIVDTNQEHATIGSNRTNDFHAMSLQ